MGIVILLVVVAVVGAVMIVLAGRTGGAAEFEPDRPNFVLPAEELRGGDVDAVRFAVGMRGYRMDQVDVVVDRLADELRARDRTIADLRGEPWPDDLALPSPDEEAAAETAGSDEDAAAETAEFGATTAEDLADRG